MNLLDYTKKLAEKIKFYDTISQNTYCSVKISNPFARPVNITVIWVEDENRD